MNTSYNHADFIGMCLDSDEEFEPYGYSVDRLQAVEFSTAEQTDKSIESVLFAPSPGHLFHD